MQVDVRCTVYGFGPSYYVDHLPSITHSQKLEKRSRGYTICQVPLHRGIQYMSLRTNHCEASVVDGTPSLEYRNTTVGSVSNNSYHRYTKSSTVNTKLLKPVDDVISKQENVAETQALKNGASVSNQFQGSHIVKCGQNNNASKNMGSMENGGNVTETPRAACNSFGSSGLFDSGKSMDSTESHRQCTAVFGTNVSGTVAGRRIDAKRNETMNEFSKCNVGDDVQLKREESALGNLPKWIADQVMLYLKSFCFW